MKAPAKFAERRRSIQWTARNSPTASAPRAGSSTGFKIMLQLKPERERVLEIDDDLAKHLPAFEPGETLFEVGERHFGVDHRQQAGRHLGVAVADIAQRAAERAGDAVLLQ